MPRKTKPPSYLKHKGPDGKMRARTVLRWPGGRREERSLGAYGSPESYAEYERLCAEWRAARAGQGGGPRPGPGARTVADVIALYWQHDVLVRRAGKREQEAFRLALRPLRRLYGHTPARDFGPKALKALRLALATGAWLSEEERGRREDQGRAVGWSRNYINRHLWRIKACFGWAESEELIPGGTRHALDTVTSLREDEPVGLGDDGRPLFARENDDVPPAPERAIAAVCTAWSLRSRTPVLNPVVRALVELQLLTGARPGELVRLRPCDLLRDGTVELAPGVDIDAGKCWVVSLRKHKTAHRNHGRVILFSPAAQEWLRPLLEGRSPDRPIFSPAEGIASWRAAQRAARRSPVQPSQRSRARPARSRPPSDQYTVRSYAHAVARACVRAGVAHWHPGQLRHNAATRLVRQFGREVTRIILGHAQLKMTRRYALEDLEKAADALERAG